MARHTHTHTLSVPVPDGHVHIFLVCWLCNHIQSRTHTHTYSHPYKYGCNIQRIICAHHTHIHTHTVFSLWVVWECGLCCWCSGSVSQMYYTACHFGSWALRFTSHPCIAAPYSPQRDSEMYIKEWYHMLGWKFIGCSQMMQIKMVLKTKYNLQSSCITIIQQ